MKSITEYLTEAKFTGTVKNYNTKVANKLDDIHLLADDEGLTYKFGINPRDRGMGMMIDQLEEAAANVNVNNLDDVLEFIDFVFMFCQNDPKNYNAAGRKIEYMPEIHPFFNDLLTLTVKKFGDGAKANLGDSKGIGRGFIRNYFRKYNEGTYEWASLFGKKKPLPLSVIVSLYRVASLEEDDDFKAVYKDALALVEEYVKTSTKFYA